MLSCARVVASITMCVLILVYGMAATWAAEDNKAVAANEQPVVPTTVIILRHAEKAGDSGNVHLSCAGEERARALARVCGSSTVEALYGVTSEGDDIRVRETLQPIAEVLKLEPKIVMINNPFDFRILRHDIRTNHSGKVILIVSHCGTVEETIKTLGGDESRCPINGYDNLCVVTMFAPGSATVVRLKYGAEK